MNKKLLSAILAAAVAAANGAVFAENAEEIMLISEKTEGLTEKNAVIDGTAAFSEEKELYIIGADGSKKIINTDENTVFAAADGNKIGIDEIKEGDTLRVIASPATTMSIPPQTYGYVVIKAAEDEIFPIYAEIQSVETEENGNKVFMSADGEYRIVCGEETRVLPFATKNIVKAEDIAEGTRIFAYSNLVTMSIPAVVPAEKIVILPEFTAENEQENEPYEIILNGERLDAQIKKDGNAYLLPLRKICEKAGLSVQWNDTVKAVSVGTVQMGANFNIGINSYKKSRMAASVLSAAPALIDGVTYVPTDFFTEILEAELETAGGAINITLTADLD